MQGYLILSIYTMQIVMVFMGVYEYLTNDEDKAFHKNIALINGAGAIINFINLLQRLA